MLTFEKIGSSSNSQVFKILENQKPTNHALKLISHDKSSGNHQSECSHLHNEYTILKKLSHPNIIKAHKLHNNSNK
jgi:serine/threonine protein kinase